MQIKDLRESRGEVRLAPANLPTRGLVPAAPTRQLGGRGGQCVVSVHPAKLRNRDNPQHRGDPLLNYAYHRAPATRVSDGASKAPGWNSGHDAPRPAARPSQAGSGSNCAKTALTSPRRTMFTTAVHEPQRTQRAQRRSEFPRGFAALRSLCSLRLKMLFPGLTCLLART